MKKINSNKAVTLIALIITVLIMLLLAAIIVIQLTGDNGIITSTKVSKDIYEYTAAKEDLHRSIMSVVADCEEKKIPYSLEELIKTLKEDNEKEIKKMYHDPVATIKDNVEIPNPTDIVVSVIQYSRFNFLIGDEGTVEGVMTGEVTDTTSKKEFEPVEEFEVALHNNNNDSIKDYRVDNESIIGYISNIQESGYSQITVKGKTSTTAQEETVNYDVHTIYYKGNLVLDGVKEYDDLGITLTEEDGIKVYSVGDKTNDVATSSVDARYTVVLKVVGNLTIGENVKLTACKSDNGYGGPKGMIIYCPGKITNDGEISMTARGCRANGQNVYLWQNAEGSSLPFEFVPATGAGGGNAYTTGRKNAAITGNTGKSGTDRRLGGGGSGGAIHGDEGGYAYIYVGGTATSYSGGTGSGAENENSGQGPPYGRAATNNGGSGGIGRVYRSYSRWAGRAAGGGTGNPGGYGASHTSGSTSNEGNNYDLRGNNGTGGLLVIYANVFENNNKITADGVSAREVSGYVMGGASGGGSINVFYKTITNRGADITANGGASKSYGGAGGNGCITFGNISSGSFVKEE